MRESDLWKHAADPGDSRRDSLARLSLRGEEHSSISKHLGLTPPSRRVAEIKKMNTPDPAAATFELSLALPLINIHPASSVAK